MDRDYDLFEEAPDGFPVWRETVSGLREARLHLFELSKTTKNECFALHLPTKEIVARVNLRTARGRRPLVFQITYDQDFAEARAKVFRLHGYEVDTVHGNEAAKILLRVPRDYDLFIIGHAAPEETRRDMAAWLKENYPRARIIALNSPQNAQLLGVDFNVKINGPETLLSVMATALRAA